MVIFYRLDPNLDHLSLGKVFVQEFKHIKEGAYGEWEVEILLIYGGILGFQRAIIER
jgi:hypothetical protein